MKPPEASALALADFEAGRTDPTAFTHRDHVRISFELLRRYTFPEALFRLARGLHRLADGAGVPGKYHETMTVAFLALIAERRWRGGSEDWEEFAAGNPDLLQKDLLATIYDPVILESAAARATFLLPHRLA